MCVPGFNLVGWYTWKENQVFPKTAPNQFAMKLSGKILFEPWWQGYVFEMDKFVFPLWRVSKKIPVVHYTYVYGEPDWFA